MEAFPGYDFDRELRAALAEAERARAGQTATPLAVVVYEMDPRFRWTRPLGLGVYHTSLELFGRELAFYGHEFAGTGLQFAPLGESIGPPARVLRRIQLAPLQGPVAGVTRAIRELAARWPGRGYDLLRRNCNHFTAEALERLTGRRQLPWYINNVATVVGALARARDALRGRGRRE